MGRVVTACILHGVQGVECSNHSVPTKQLKIQSLYGGWIFLCALVFLLVRLLDFSAELYPRWHTVLPIQRLDQQ